MAKRIFMILLALALLLSLTACSKKEEAYQAAMALLEAGSYEEAAAGFAALGDYQDAPQQAAAATQLAQEAAEEARKEAIYQEATGLLSFGPDTDFDANARARELLASIPGYKDADEIYSHIRKVVMGTTQNVLSTGDSALGPNYYDEYGRPLKEDQFYHTYGEDGLIVSSLSGDATIYYEYDSQGRLIRKWNEGGLAWVNTYVYNDAGQLIEQTNEGISVTTYHYDEHGNQIKRVSLWLSGYSQGKKSVYQYTYTYDESGRITFVNKFYFDPWNDVTQTSWRVTYDEDGDPLVDEHGREQLYGYTYAPLAE